MFSPICFCQLCGGAILGIGIWVAVDDEAFDTLGITNPDGMNDPLWAGMVYTSIAVGALIFLVGTFGWAGACCKNRCMLITVSRRWGERRGEGRGGGGGAAGVW